MEYLPHRSTHMMRQNGIDDPAPPRDADTEPRTIHPGETIGFPAMLVLPSWYTQYWLTDQTDGQRRPGLLHWVRASLRWMYSWAAPPSRAGAATMGQRHEPERADWIAADPDHGFVDRKRSCRTH